VLALAQYGEMPGAATSPPTDAVFTIVPPRSDIAGSSARIARHTPFKLMSIRRSNSLLLSASGKAGPVGPF
jgi:hypothetical protein